MVGDARRSFALVKEFIWLSKGQKRIARWNFPYLDLWSLFSQAGAFYQSTTLPEDVQPHNFRYVQSQPLQSWISQALLRLPSIVLGFFKRGRYNRISSRWIKPNVLDWAAQISVARISITLQTENSSWNKSFWSKWCYNGAYLTFNDKFKLKGRGSGWSTLPLKRWKNRNIISIIVARLRKEPINKI